MEIGNPTLFALVLLIINGGALWIREWRKHRTWAKNGDDLKEIKGQVKTIDEKVDCIDKKVGETKVAVDDQKTQCAATVTRFDKAISDQNRTMISLAKNTGRKR